jgi:hypothetical protein
VVVATVGAFLGYEVAYQASVGGLGGALGAAFIAYAIGGLVLIAVLVGVANSLRREGRGRVASRYSFATAGLLLAGAGSGFVAVPVLDIGYHEPVTLEARGEATVTLADVPEFVPRPAGRADCHSVPDGTDVAEVVALSLGELNGNVLRADIYGGTISLFVDAAHLPEGSVPPMWTTAAEATTSSGATTGTVRFDDAPLRVDPELGRPVGTWPETLSGEVEWSCGPWFDPDASAPSPSEGHVSLNLSGVEWQAAPDAPAACEFEADGSVGNVTSDAGGLLQGVAVSLSLGLSGDPRAGDEVDLMLSVHLPTPPGTVSGLPIGALLAATSGRGLAWADLVTIGEVSPDGLNGSLSFTDIGMPGTKDPAWPLTLSGDLSWKCG